MKSGGQAIPGATVAIAQGGQERSTVTDADGHYTFPTLAPGDWMVSVQMFGFEPLKKTVDYAAAKGPVNFEIKLKESPLVERTRQFAARSNTGANPELNLNDAAQEAAPAPAAQGNENSNEAFLISGSISPGTAQGAQADSGPDVRVFMGNMMNERGAANVPGFGGGGLGGRGFGGPARTVMVMRRGGGGRGRPPGGVRFGNRRRRNQIRGMASFTLNNSALDAKPFSINGLDIPQAAYAQSRFSFIGGGPLVIPHLVHSPNTQFFVTYFGTRARTPELFTETVPTAAERSGDFSGAVQALGGSGGNVPVAIFNPATHQPFAGNAVPSNLLNPISLGLLNLYPLPSEPQQANNYQFETAQASNTDNLGLHVSRNVTSVDRLFVNFQYQNRNGSAAQPFGYSDTNSGYGTNASLMWMRNLSSTALSNFQVR
ncbi:MAG: carboxypeptidase-like regulatory domain-containing protein, partial [Bryobacteraceae bacterium]